MTVVACTSEVSEEEMAAKTRTILDSVNKKLLRHLGGFADSIREVQKGSLLAAYTRYCNFDYDLPPAQFAYNVCTLYGQQEGGVGRVVTLELYHFYNYDNAAAVNMALKEKVERLQQLKPRERFCVNQPAQRIHQVYWSGSFLLALNIQGHYSEKELSTITEVADAELHKYR